MNEEKKIIEESLMRVLLRKKFKDIAIDEVLRSSKIKSEKFYSLFQNKEQILVSFFNRIDLIMKRKIKKMNLGRNIKDNLFEVCMTRFELLNSYRESINNIYSSIKIKPNIKIDLYDSFFNSMKLILKLSYVNIKPINGHINLIVFSLIYLSIQHQWFEDFSINNEKTMAVLDKRLSMIENLLIKVG